MDSPTGFSGKLRRLVSLLRQFEDCPDPALRAAARELAGTLLDLHGIGLRRMIELARQDGTMLDHWKRDALVASLLALHGLHPEDLSTRVEQAVRGWQAPHGRAVAEAELVSASNGAVRIRLHTGEAAAGIPAAALRRSLEDAVYEAAPDLSDLAIEGDPEPAHRPGFVPLSMLLGNL